MSKDKSSEIHIGDSIIKSSDRGQLLGIQWFKTSFFFDAHLITAHWFGYLTAVSITTK